MFRDQIRYGRDPNVVVRAADATFYAPLKWREPRLVFTCSWSDWFIEEADQHRDEMWSIIRRTPHLTYQILTKRPERIAEHLPADWGPTGYPNVWLGVSAENQVWANRRIPLLLNTPARVRFLSAEPLLKPIDLTHMDVEATAPEGPHYFYCINALTGRNRDMGRPCADVPHLDWVIVGGESGGRPGHPPRPMELEWARSIKDQCVEAGIPYFLKQMGGARPGGPALLDGQEWRQMPT